MAMGEFSATDAAFEGFRVAREKPAAIAAWTVAWFVISMVQAAIAIQLGGQAFADLMQMANAAQAGAKPDPARTLQLYAQVAPTLLALAPLSIFFYGVMYCAAFRLVLEPSSRFGLAVGRREVQQALLAVVNGAVLFFVYIGAAAVAGLFAGLAYALSPSLGELALGLLFIGVIGVSLWAAVRLSLAGPQTFQEARLRPFDSWRITHGHFWPMFGAYFLATIFAVLVWALGAMVLSGVALLAPAEAEGAQSPTTLAALFTPAALLNLVGLAILMSLTWAIIICPAAVIYRGLKKPQGDETFA